MAAIFKPLRGPRFRAARVAAQRENVELGRSLPAVGHRRNSSRYSSRYSNRFVVVILSLKRFLVGNPKIY